MHNLHNLYKNKGITDMSMEVIAVLLLDHLKFRNLFLSLKVDNDLYMKIDIILYQYNLLIHEFC